MLFLKMKLPDAAYIVEIDEEGFPMFSGIRSLDDELNGQIFRGIRRSDPSRLSSRLMTQFADGKLAWIDAFDDPLVVQSVDRKSADSLWLHFPGGYDAEVSLAALSIDFFGRFHVFVGTAKVPAVFSRKAQAALLHLDGVPEALAKAPHFRVSDSPAESAKFWSELYDSGGDGWELNQVTPAIRSRVLKNKNALGPRILVPAAGRGHEAAFLDSEGFKVTALDFSARAREEFIKRYPRSSVDYQVVDAFQYFQQHPRSFDGLCEHTFYCAIPPTHREQYWEKVALTLRSGGFLFGLFYLKTHPGGPPFGCTQWEIREFSKKDFEIVEWEIAPDSNPRRMGEELWVRLKKK